MRLVTLEAWLAWQETQHPKRIDLGLERIAQVARRLNLTKPAPTVITVGGTNGKGSCVALLEAIFLQSGYRVGAYTSPHLLRYNERVRIDGVVVSDAALCEAFAVIDQARGEISLSYFEFGTLAALWLFARAALDVAVLEVGLGGRLDATNIQDADLALITSIDLDHTEWLGPDRAAIAREKAGIMRPGRPVICGDPDPPASLLMQAQRLGARLFLLGHDFTYARHGDCWDFMAGQTGLDLPSRKGLPLPQVPVEAQLRNAATVLMGLTTLAGRLSVTQAAIEAGLAQGVAPARCQRLTEVQGLADAPGAVETVLDVAHNPAAVSVLGEYLARLPITGRTHAVFGVAADKDAQEMVRILAPQVNAWYLGAPATERALSVQRLSEAVRAGAPQAVVETHDTVALAYRRACRGAMAHDRVVVFGSFYTVAEVLALSV